MAEVMPVPVVGQVQARDPEVVALLDASTSELALGGYSADETFGYSLHQLEQADVHLVGARVRGQPAPAWAESSWALTAVAS